MEPLLDHYYLKQPEPIQGCLLALKDIIMQLDENITQQRRFQIPFFYYKDKKLSYLWVTKKKIQIGFVEDKNIHPKKEGIKLKDKYQSMLINPNDDIPIELILTELNEKIDLYRSILANK